MIDTIPTTWNLVNLNACKVRAQKSNVLTKDLDPAILFREGIQRLLSLKIGSRTVRSMTTRYVKENFWEFDQPAYLALFEQTINTILQINKKIPIVGVSQSTRVILDTVIQYDANIDLIYSRQDGPCYSIILTDMIDYNYQKCGTDVLSEHIASHIAICSAVLCDMDATKDTLKYIEAIVPHHDKYDKYCKRYLIKLDSEALKYVDFCRKTMINVCRRYCIEEEHVVNWSDQCIRCSQEGRCKMFRNLRGWLRDRVCPTRS